VLQVGDVVEPFEAVDQEGRTVRSEQLLESGPAVLFFYVKAKTSG
jgi:peroxiredoxin